MVIPKNLVGLAHRLLASAKQRGLKIATAESCTGGLVSAIMTEIPGSSAVFDRGFVTYSNQAKRDMLGVSAKTLKQHGAVSRETALAMAKGALVHSESDLAVAITGIAGPDGGTKAKPVGLVHIAAAARGGARIHRECRFGAVGRDKVREKSARVALDLLKSLVAKQKSDRK